jgi:hypothetical protein
MKDEALKLALEALELNNDEWKSLADSGDCGYWNAEDQDHYKQTNKAITAIKQALAAPVQEPAARLKGVDEYGPMLDWYTHWVTIPIGTKLYTTPPAAPTQPAPEQYTALEQALTRLQKRYGELEAKVAAQPAVPDVLTQTYGENHPREYVQGWNDCRAEMLKGMKP